MLALVIISWLAKPNSIHTWFDHHELATILLCLVLA